VPFFQTVIPVIAKLELSKKVGVEDEGSVHIIVFVPSVSTKLTSSALAPVTPLIRTGQSRGADASGNLFFGFNTAFAHVDSKIGNQKCKEIRRNQLVQLLSQKKEASFY
jgi:hypothetical protein